MVNGERVFLTATFVYVLKLYVFSSLLSSFRAQPSGSSASTWAFISASSCPSDICRGMIEGVEIFRTVASVVDL
jgi:hypothetical protein